MGPHSTGDGSRSARRVGNWNRLPRVERPYRTRERHRLRNSRLGDLGVDHLLRRHNPTQDPGDGCELGTAGTNSRLRAIPLSPQGICRDSRDRPFGVHHRLALAVGGVCNSHQAGAGLHIHLAGHRCSHYRFHTVCGGHGPIAKVAALKQ